MYVVPQRAWMKTSTSTALQAPWGYGTRHDGERYEVHLCEDCFFLALANLKEERRVQHMFSADAPERFSDLGLLVRNDFFRVVTADRSPAQVLRLVEVPGIVLNLVSEVSNERAS